MSAAGDELAVRMVVSGRVQGVGFRYFTRQAAVGLGLVGWVRNLASGEVEVRVTGAAATLEAFRRQIRRGPPGSRVDSLSESESAVVAEDNGFQILY